MGEEADAAQDHYAAFLDKLWNTLFGKGVGGLVAPRDIRRHQLTLETVRNREREEIAEVEAELDGLVHGRLRLDHGKLREAASDSQIEGVRMNAVIDAAFADSLVTRLDTVSLLEQATREQAMQEVRRAMAMRRIAILAEEEGKLMPLDPVSSVPVDPDWLLRWRVGAQDAVAEDVRRFWARLLAGEVIRPFTYSVRTMEFMSTVSRSDLEMISICARFCFRGFIYRNPGKYFSVEIHQPMFEQMEELGLLRGVYGRPESEVLTSSSDDRFRTMLPCQNRAIFLEGSNPEDDVRIPVFRLTRFGREVISLCPAEADTAYLLAVANELKRQGLEVRLGDWMGEGGRQGLFAERMAL